MTAYLTYTPHKLLYFKRNIQQVPAATEVQDEPAQVLDTYEEPEVSKPPTPKRLNSTGSLKVNHLLYLVLADENKAKLCVWCIHDF